MPQESQYLWSTNTLNGYYHSRCLAIEDFIEFAVEEEERLRSEYSEFYKYHL